MNIVEIMEQLDEDLQSIENLTLENERLFTKAQLQVATRSKTKQATNHPCKNQ